MAPADETICFLLEERIAVRAAKTLADAWAEGPRWPLRCSSAPADYEGSAMGA
jgi:hypothetical protein